MPYCQSCGAEVNGSFCSACGAPVNAVASAANQPIIHENANVVPRYKAGSVVLAGYLGAVILFSTLLVSIIFLVAAIASIGTEVPAGGITPLDGILGTLIVAVPMLGISYLCYLPGIRSIKRNSPEGEVKKTGRSFFIKSLLFNPALAIALFSCAFLIGILLKGWRVLVAVCTPKNNEYTALVDGKKIGVTRLIDKQCSYGDTVRFIYVDDNGEYYRPPLY